MRGASPPYSEAAFRTGKLTNACRLQEGQGAESFGGACPPVPPGDQDSHSDVGSHLWGGGGDTDLEGTAYYSVEWQVRAACS